MSWSYLTFTIHAVNVFYFCWLCGRHHLNYSIDGFTFRQQIHPMSLQWNSVNFADIWRSWLAAMFLKCSKRLIGWSNLRYNQHEWQLENLFFCVFSWMEVELAKPKLVYNLFNEKIILSGNADCAFMNIHPRYHFIAVILKRMIRTILHRHGM